MGEQKITRADFTIGEIVEIIMADGVARRVLKAFGAKLRTTPTIGRVEAISDEYILLARSTLYDGVKVEFDGIDCLRHYKLVGK